MREQPTIETLYGTVDRRVLERLQHRFDTRRLLDSVDALDRVQLQLCAAEGLRQEILALHGMAHVLLNGAASPPGGTVGEPIWALAERLAAVLLESMEELQGAYEAIAPLATLAPYGEEGDEPLEDAGVDN